MRNLLRRVDAVYHFAAYQDYLPEFARFSEVNVVSTALLYQIIVEERLEMARVVVASSQAAMGEGLYRCPVDGDQLPGIRSESMLAAGQWDIPCPDCGGPLAMQATTERISNPQNPYGMSKIGQEMVAVHLGRRYQVPTAALRYSIVQGPRQSVFNAYSGACRIFCLHYGEGRAPTLYEDGESIRDYVNINDVVDANILVMQDDRAIGNVFNVGGGVPVSTREFAEVVRRQYDSDRSAIVPGEYRFGDTRHILSDITALEHARLVPHSDTGRFRGGLCRMARGHRRTRWHPRCGKCKHALSGSGTEGGLVKAFLLAAGTRNQAAAAHRPHAEMPAPRRGHAAPRPLAGRPPPCRGG